MTVVTAPQLPAVDPARRRRPGVAIALIAGFVAVIVLTVVVTLALSGDKGPEATGVASVAAPATFTLRGELLLRGGADGIAYPNGLANATIGSSCFGAGGYDDISIGTQVSVTVNGRVVALSELGEGRMVEPYQCTFPIAVDGVPDGAAFYEVEVANRGAVPFDAAKARDSVTLTLG